MQHGPDVVRGVVDADSEMRAVLFQRDLETRQRSRLGAFDVHLDVRRMPARVRGRPLERPALDGSPSSAKRADAYAFASKRTRRVSSDECDRQR